MPAAPSLTTGEEEAAAAAGEATEETNMAPSARPSSTELDMEEDESEYGIQKADRKVTPGADGGMRGGAPSGPIGSVALVTLVTVCNAFKKKKKKD